MDDIAPGLLEELRASFLELVNQNATIAQLQKAVQNGTATYVEAEDFAYHVGVALSQAFSMHLSSAVLPDGRMYFNIADRVLRPLFEDDHKMVSEVATQVQTVLNHKAGINIMAQTAPLDVDRIDGFINKISAADSFDDVAWVLGDPVVNYSQSVVESVLKANVSFQGKSGLHPKIIRKAERKCCEWCNALAGEYDYPDVPDDIYRRHENCRCTVEYDPGTGRRQNVHTKKLTPVGQSDIIEERRKIGLGNLGIFRPNEYHNTIRMNVGVNRDEVAAAAKAGKRHSGVYVDAMGKTRNQLQRSIINRTAEVERHADKIKHPESYVADWDSRDPRYQAGLLRKWEKDMIRNAEQAEIELSVFEERF